MDTLENLMNTYLLDGRGKTLEKRQQGLEFEFVSSLSYKSTWTSQPVLPQLPIIDDPEQKFKTLTDIYHLIDPTFNRGLHELGISVKDALWRVWMYYVHHIRGKRKTKHYRMAWEKPDYGSHSRPYKECGSGGGICVEVAYSFNDSVIYRHPERTEFGKALLKLGYRYCKDCKRMMPKEECIKRMPQAKRTKMTLSSPIPCPCCGIRTAHVSYIIRRTKMGDALFSGEGY